MEAAGNERGKEQGGEIRVPGWRSGLRACWGWGMAVLWGAGLLTGGLWAEERDTLPGGVRVLVRPGAVMEPAKEEELEEGDPLAAEKKRLRAWEQALNATADSLAERLRLMAERERMLAERERELMLRVSSLDAREEALAAREDLIRAREKMPDLKAWSGPAAPSIVGKYAMVIDAANGRILHEKAAYAKVPVASTQKLMTALLVEEAGELEKPVVIEPGDTKVEPVMLGFKAGDVYTRADLLRWLLVKSGNDVALALARDHAGSVEAFCAKMTKRAKELGMTDTLFKNPNGLPIEGQYSTARDMALLAWECYQWPFIRECVGIKSFRLEMTSGTVREGTNTNRLLRDYPYCNGMKTGFTYAAGNCLISSGVKDGRERIAVVLNSTGSWIAKDSQALLDWSLSYD